MEQICTFEYNDFNMYTNIYYIVDTHGYNGAVKLVLSLQPVEYRYGWLIQIQIICCIALPVR